MVKEKKRSFLDNFKAVPYVFANSLKILLSDPKLLWIFVIEIGLNTLISFLLYQTAIKPNYPEYSASVRFWQIDPVINSFGDFLKLLIKGNIPPLLFCVETLRSSFFFFISTITSIVLARSVKKSIEGKDLNILKEWRLKKPLLIRVLLWTVLHQAIFLSTTYIFDKALKFSPQIHHLYYALSLMGASIVVFYINPILAFEDKPLNKVLKEVFLFIYNTWFINVVWIIIGALWFTFMTDPRLKVTMENITIQSGLLLFTKIAISPIAAILWYRSIKHSLEE